MGVGVRLCVSVVEFVVCVCDLSPLEPSDGQRRRRVGQLEEALREARAQEEQGPRQAGAAEGLRRGRHRGRPLQGHLGTRTQHSHQCASLTML